MARKSLVGVVADELLDRIIAGEFPPGASVPGELELSSRHEVSRMTVREAMKTLEAQRILSVERGRGTFVNPLNRWGSLDAVLRAASEGKNDASAAIQLIELRRMLETGACELAAGRMADSDIQTLRAQRREDAAGAREQRSGGVRRGGPRLSRPHPAGVGKRVRGRIVRPLHRVLEKRRTETSKVPEIQEHAIGHHQNIADALASRDPHRARDAMDAHMQQTLDDLKTYVLAEGPA